MTVEDLALQECVICGQITHEEAVAGLRKEYGLEAPAAQRLSERMRNREGKRPRSRTESSHFAVQSPPLSPMNSPSIPPSKTR